MMVSLEPVPITVKCYSGHTYAERPVSFLWEGQEHQIKEIQQTWQEPGKRLFRVVTSEDRHYELCYNEGEDKWLLTKAQE